jgi:hypothetical protein
VLRRSRSRSRRWLGLAAILSITAAYATLVQGPGWNQNSHFALVRAIADQGVPWIDVSRYQTGQTVTYDISVYKGHTYSNKAPGFAFAALPAYLAMEAAGQAWPPTDASGQLWFLGLWIVVLPAFVLLLLVRRLADELEPGFGTAAAITLGAGTLMLPFATLFFSHILSALLGFAAFAVLWYERRRAASLTLVAAAGLLTGYAVTTEFPNVIIAAILGLAAVARPSRIRRAAAFGVGALVGLAPLLAYDQWAFGSPFRVPYSYTTGFGSTGSLFLTPPSFRRLIELLFAPVGILRTTPVLALAAVGIVLLFRRGCRYEAFVVAGIGLAFLVLEASYATPFGGGSPGPRQLIPMLPFLALPLAAAFERIPLTTSVLAVVSVVEMVAATITHPIIYKENHADWFHRLGAGDFSATVLTFFGGRRFTDALLLRSTPGWLPLLVFLVLVLLAIAFTAAGRPPIAIRPRDALQAGLCLCGWALLDHEGPKMLYGGHGVGREWAPAVVLSIAAGVVIVASVVPYVLTSEAARSPR